MNVRLLDDYVLVKPIETEAKTAGGIIIADNYAEKPQIGRVEKVGPGKWDGGVRLLVQVKEGNTILYRKNAGAPIKLETEDFIIMKESDIYLAFE